jgi:hypothetical protein
MTATTILSEAGWDMIKWKDENHFVSWLRLAPDNRISGERIIGKGRLPTSNRVTVSFAFSEQFYGSFVNVSEFSLEQA